MIDVIHRASNNALIGYRARVPESPKPPRRSPSPSERQRDPERTKARILEAAKAEFGAKGYVGARVSEIANSAGINKQLISYYFGGKEGLYTEVTAAIARRNLALTDPGRSLAETARDFIEETDRESARLFLWENLAEDEPAPGDEGREFLAQQVDYMRARQAAGDFPEDIDPAHLLLIVISAAMAPWAFPKVASSISGQDPASPEFAETFAEQLSLVLGHLRPER
jgi:TetR/AcrR family transcriptional regulator